MLISFDLPSGKVLKIYHNFAGNISLNVFRKLKTIFLGLFAAIVLLLLAAILLSIIYQDRITETLLGELNKNIRTEIKTEKIRFSLVRKFPFASLEFTNILAHTEPSFSYRDEAYSKGDTLFSFHSLFLEFNIMDLLRKNYRIRRFHAVEGNINLAVDRNGHANYEFWKTHTGSKSSGLNLKLPSVRLTQVDLMYWQMQDSLRLKVRIDKSVIRGSLASDNYSLSANVTGALEEFRIDSVTYVSRKSLDAELPVKIAGKRVELLDGRIALAGNAFLITGLYQGDQQPSVDLKISSDHLQLSNLPGLLPARISSTIQPLKARGNAGFRGIIKGPVSAGRQPHIEITVKSEVDQVSFEVNGLEILHAGFSVAFSNGVMNNASTSTLRIDRLSGIVHGNPFHLAFSLKPFHAPAFVFKWNGTVDLDDLRTILPNDTLGFFHGKVTGTLQAKGRFTNLKTIKAADFANFEYNGNLALQGIRITNPKILLGVSELSCRVRIDQDWSVDSLSAELDGNHMEGSGILRNFMPWLLQNNGRLSILGSVSSEDFDLGKMFAASTAGGPDSSKILFPQTIDLDLYFKASHFGMDRFSATHVSGKVSYQPRLFDLKSLYFETMEGNLSGSAILLQKPDLNFILRTQVKLDRINITTLFYTFKNFGQTVLVDKHLKGKVSGFLNFASEWNNSFTISSPSILTDGNLTVDNGELIGFEPLNGLSKHINVSELQHIYFTKLQSDILIRNRVITIPQMDIESATFDILGSGVHDFDNNFTYKLQVSLSEQLYRKARSAQKEMDEFGIMEISGNRKINLPLLVKGNIDNYKVSYDTRQATQNMIQNLKKEKKQVKSILNKEFGLFKKDTLTFRSDTGAAKNNFVIEWDDQKYQDGQAAPDNKQKKNTRARNRKEPADTSRLKIEWE